MDPTLSAAQALCNDRMKISNPRKTTLRFIPAILLSKLFCNAVARLVRPPCTACAANRRSHRAYGPAACVTGLCGKQERRRTPTLIPSAYPRPCYAAVRTVRLFRRPVRARPGRSVFRPGNVACLSYRQAQTVKNLEAVGEAAASPTFVPIRRFSGGAGR